MSGPVGDAELVALRDAVITIARRAGAAILEVYEAADPGAMKKADDSPLTQADLRAHRIIVDALRALSPALPVLSEEDAGIPWEERARWRRYWLVDPLDGTKEFLSKNGEFTVNIALVVDHAPVLGVVYVPVTDTVYDGVIGAGGGAGGGARRTVGRGVTEAIAVRAPAASPLRIVGSRSHRGDSLDALLAALGPHELVAIGSSLKLCRVAEGAADLYPRLGPTSEWDTAAAHAVVIAAGGFVTTVDGAPLRYNAKADLLNPSFLVFGDGSRDWRAVFRT